MVKVVLASGSQDLIPALIERVKAIGPDLPLYVFAEFPPEQGRWIPYHPARSFAENYACCRAALRGRRVRFSAVMLQPRTPYWRMRLIGLLLNPAGFIAFNENFDHFMLRSRSAPAILRHCLWRVRNFIRSETQPGGSLYAFLCMLANPRSFARPMLHVAAYVAGAVAALWKAILPPVPDPKPVAPFPGGISLVMDSESGLTEVRHSHVYVVRDGVIPHPDFLAALMRAFDEVPDLFAATARPWLPLSPERFDPPIPGEDRTYVLCGRRGDTLYSTQKLQQLGGIANAGAGSCEEIGDCPQAVPASNGLSTAGGGLSPILSQLPDDLTLGYRAWQRGWPTVLVAGTQHAQPRGDEATPGFELNYLRFLARAVASPALFLRLWRGAIGRHRDESVAFWKATWRAPVWVEPAPRRHEPEESIFALSSGQVAVFPGRKRQGRTVVLVASPYLPFPLSHGGAVRMFNLMRRAVADYDLVLVSFTDGSATPPPELLDICCEIVLVGRVGSHLRPTTQRPDVVLEFDSPAFRAALRQTVRKWRPAIAQLEFTQMAQYAPDCAPAATVLVEEDITFDFYRQLLQHGEDWETRRQMIRWQRFETEAWRRVNLVVTMSDSDRRMVAGARCESLPNGVDLELFRPSQREPDPARLLFVGPFSHLPNILAMKFFLNEVWPLLAAESPVLQIVAGRDYQRHLKCHRDRVNLELAEPRIEVEEFVDDLRPVYERATLVVAPMIVSAGTKIKVLEAMASGKAVVATPGGVRGLDVTPGNDVLVASDACGMAAAILQLLRDPARRKQIEHEARATAQKRYSWDLIAKRQQHIYHQLTK